MVSTKHVAAVTCGLILLFLAGKPILNLFASDETKIRRLTEGMVSAFNRQNTAHVIEPIALDFEDRSSGVDRELLKLSLIQLYFEAKDPVTKKFLYRAEVVEDSLEVDFPEGLADARMRCVIRFSTLDGEARVTAWIVEIQALLRDGENGWKFTESTHQTLDGERVGGS